MSFHLEQGSEEWFQARLGRFTASKIYTLLAYPNRDTLSQGAYTYIHEKVCEILTGSGDRFSNQATDRGNDLEPEAVAAYEKRTGNRVFVPGFITKGDYAGASPDGLVLLDTTIQVKCPEKKANHLDFLLMEDGKDLAKTDKKYYAQVQMEMWVTGRPKCDFISYHPDFPKPMDLKIITVLEDPSFQRLISMRIDMASKILIELLEKVRK